MKVLIIDGQGGGLGRQLVSAVKEKCPETEVLAVGTNSTATGAMLRAGADQAATGENAVKLLKGEAEISDMPVYFMDQNNTTVYYNSTIAEKIGLTIPQEIITKGVDMAK